MNEVWIEGLSSSFSFSTTIFSLLSVKVEPKYFTAEIRDSMKMVFENPDFEQTFFGNSNFRIYRRSKSTGEWKLVPN